jgi:hypothetical protein
MNGNNAVDTVRDSLATARDSLTEVRMTTPLDTIVRHGRARRRRHRLTGLAGAAVVAAGTVLAVTALLPASHLAPRQPRVQLAAWTVVKQPGGIIHVTMRELHDPAGLQAALRADGVPASVSFGNGQQTPCRPYPGGGFMTSANLTLIQSVFLFAPSPPGTSVSIRPSALPRGTGVLLAFLQRSHPQPGVPAMQLEAAVVRASQQCTGS